MKPKPIPVTSGLDNPILRAISQPVEKITPDIKQLIDVMFVTMEKEEGIGIAAPQCGVNLRMAWVKLNPGTKKQKNVIMINPEILKRSMRMEANEEGCLSLRGKWGKVSRAYSLSVRWMDEKWHEHEAEFQGLNARIVQHEVDHLDGTLFWDRVQPEEEGNEAESGV